ncbi:MAG TPA: response regulator [bacterium]|nr:response regulator [bacterium]
MKSRILIVDDDRNVIHMLVLFLVDLGYEVIPARDGLSAVTLAVKYLPDLIILDVMMPKMSGYQTCEFIRRKEGLQNLPIVFLTAKGQPHDEEYGKKIGGSAYLTKPINFPVLEETIATLIHEHPMDFPNRPAVDLTDPGIQWVG